MKRYLSSLSFVWNYIQILHILLGTNWDEPRTLNVCTVNKGSHDRNQTSKFLLMDRQELMWLVPRLRAMTEDIQDFWRKNNVWCDFRSFFRGKSIKCIYLRLVQTYLLNVSRELLSINFENASADLNYAHLNVLFSNTMKRFSCVQNASFSKAFEGCLKPVSNAAFKCVCENYLKPPFLMEGHIFFFLNAELL